MMLSFYRLAEVAIYSLLNFLPFLALALYPFRHSLRFSINTTFFLIVLVTILQLFLGAGLPLLPETTPEPQCSKHHPVCCFLFSCPKKTLWQNVFYTFNDFKSCEPRCNFIKDHRKSFLP